MVLGWLLIYWCSEYFQLSTSPILLEMVYGEQRRPYLNLGFSALIWGKCISLTYPFYHGEMTVIFVSCNGTCSTHCLQWQNFLRVQYMPNVSLQFLRSKILLLLKIICVDLTDPKKMCHKTNIACGYGLTCLCFYKTFGVPPGPSSHLTILQNMKRCYLVSDFLGLNLI